MGHVSHRPKASLHKGRGLRPPPTRWTSRCMARRFCGNALWSVAFGLGLKWPIQGTFLFTTGFSDAWMSWHVCGAHRLARNFAMWPSLLETPMQIYVRKSTLMRIRRYTLLCNQYVCSACLTWLPICSASCHAADLSLSQDIG